MQRAQPLMRALLRATLAQTEASTAQQLLCASSFHTAGICSSLSSPKRSAMPSLPQRNGSLASSLLLQGAQVRHAGHDVKPEVPGNAIDNWAEMRLSHNKEKPNNLGGSYYMNVGIFGFAYLLNEAYFFPPRTVYVALFVFALLYVRKGNFVPSFPQH